ncbi:hypothetical protein [Pararhodobacter aggregans]
MTHRPAFTDPLDPRQRADIAIRHLRRQLATEGPGLEDRARLNTALAAELLAAGQRDEALDAVCAALVIDLPEVLPQLAEVLAGFAQEPRTVQGALRLVRARAVAGLSGEALARVLAVSGQHLLALAMSFDHGSVHPDRAREQALAGEAFADLTAALVVPQPEAVHAARAEALLDEGRAAEAVAPAGAALKAARDRQDARFAALAGGALGRALAATGQAEEARRVLREAVPLLREEWGEGIAQVEAAEAALSALA